MVGNGGKARAVAIARGRNRYLRCKSARGYDWRRYGRGSAEGGSRAERQAIGIRDWGITAASWRKFRIARKNRSVRESNFGDDESMTSNVQFANVDQAVKTLDETQAWQQLCERDSSARFFYAVATTGVFCRPDCRSRRPLRENVRFFETTDAAQAAGFRPCKRCKPSAPRRNALDQLRAHLEANLDRAVPLAEWDASRA